MSVSGERVGREEDWKGEPLHVVPSITLRCNNNHHDLRRDYSLTRRDIRKVNKANVSYRYHT